MTTTPPRPLSPTTATARKRVLLLTPDIEGPVRNGGIGTAFTALAAALTATGHHVTIFYTLGKYTEQGTIAQWTAHYAHQGIRFIARPDPQGPFLSTPWPRTNAWHTYEWLRDFPEQFDVIYCPEWRGEAYYALLARRMGLHFRNTPFITVTHSPSVWSQEGNYRLPTSIEDLETEFMEQQCIALADHLVSPSDYMFSWLDRRNWPMPAARTMVPNCIPPNLAALLEHAHVPSIPIRELVFFGRLEERKGLTLLIKALDRLKPDAWMNIQKLTFLGKSSEDASYKMLLERRDTNRWPVPVQITTDMDRTQANYYLAGPGRLSIMASLSDNSPYSVVECLCQGSPFLATRVGGIPELVHPDDRERVLFDPNPQALAARIEKIVQSQESIIPARMAFAPKDLPARWAELTSHIISTTPRIAPPADLPSITVCVTHHERPTFLKEALKSLARQTYNNFEVVIVDDGSTSAEARDYLDQLGPDLARRGWRLVRGDNRYPGAARNLGVKHARGEYVMFMDDDNIARPQELEIFARAARQIDADILTCGSDIYTHQLSARRNGKPRERWLPLGASAAAGAFLNCFGDANALIRRSFFEKIGGFTEDYGVGHEDWELFATAIRHDARFFVVPEVLFLYRCNEHGVQRSSDILRSHSRSVRPFSRNPSVFGGSGMAYALHLHLQTRPTIYTPQQTSAISRFAVFRAIVRTAVDSHSLRRKFWTSLRQRGVSGTFEIVWRYTLHRLHR